MRWILRLVGAFTLCLALAVGLVFLIPSDRVAAIASREFEQATGRRLSFQGTIRPMLWPPGIRTGPVEIANAPWSGEGPIMVADDLRLGVALWPLLLGRVEIGQLRIDRPRLLLERDAGGRVNWQLPERRGPGPAMSVARISVADASLVLIDRQTAVRRVAQNVQADLALPIAGDGAGRFDIDAMVEGRPLVLTAELATARGLLGGEVAPLRLRGTFGGLDFDFDGRAGLSPAAAEGRIALRLDDIGRIGASGATPVPVELSGEATLTPERSLHLREGEIRIGETRLSAAADLTTGGPPPRLRAELSGPAFDATPLLALRGDGGGGGLVPEPIQGGWLHALDADVLFDLESLRWGGLEAGPVRLLAALDRARLVLGLQRAELYGGELAGEIVLNGRDGFSAGTDLRATGLDLGPLLAALTGSARLTGRADATLRLLGAGGSVAALMNGLSGQGHVAIGPGGLEGIDLPALLQRGAGLSDGGSTGFDRLGASFRIADGILANDDLRMEAAGFTMDGSGTVGIGPRTVNYRLDPAPSTRAGAGRIRVPVLITGTWADPRIRLGIPSAADEAVAQERQRLEAEEGGTAP